MKVRAVRERHSASDTHLAATDRGGRYVVSEVPLYFKGYCSVYRLLFRVPYFGVYHSKVLMQCGRMIPRRRTMGTKRAVKP
jgi:hypothetical protein